MPGLRSAVRTRFRVEAILAAVSSLLFVLSLLWRDWLEVFGIDPDHGSGTTEWLIVATLLASSVSLTLLARRDRRRTAKADARTPLVRTP